MKHQKNPAKLCQVRVPISYRTSLIGSVGRQPSLSAPTSLRSITQEKESGDAGAGSGNRTRIFSLEGCCSTTELYPRVQDPMTEWWRELDLNQRRLSQRIYSPSPLTTRASLQFFVRIVRPSLLDFRSVAALGLRRVYDRTISSCQHDDDGKYVKNVIGRGKPLCRKKSYTERSAAVIKRHEQRQ